jgi:hypothetical protein
MKIIYFNSILETILKDMLKDYLSILIGDVNIDMLKKKRFNQQHFKTLFTNTNWNSLLLKTQPLIIHK